MWEEREDDEHKLLEPNPAFALRPSHINSPSRVIPSQRVQIAAGGSPKNLQTLVQNANQKCGTVPRSRRKMPSLPSQPPFVKLSE
jgi:hypothetical protein